MTRGGLDTKKGCDRISGICHIDRQLGPKSLRNLPPTTHSDPLLGLLLQHPTKEISSRPLDFIWHLKHASFDFQQQHANVIIVKG